MGLVCVPQSDGTLRCSNKLDGLVRNEDSGAQPGQARPPLTDAAFPPPDVAVPPAADDGAAEAADGATE